MPTGVFPFLGSYGSSKGVTGASRFTRPYHGGYRTYLRAATAVDRVTLRVNGVTKVKRDAIDVFFRARMQGTSQALFEFYIYDSDIVSAVDLTGASTTGRRIGIFPEVDEELQWDRSGSCRWSTSIPMLLVG